MKEADAPSRHCERQEERSPAACSVLKDVGSSIQASQRALLSGDVDGLERLTQEQSSTLLRFRQIIATDECTPAASRAAKQVLEVGRILEFLLRRMQQKLIVAVNCSSESQATYQPPCQSPGAGTVSFVSVPGPAVRS